MLPYLPFLTLVTSSYSGTAVILPLVYRTGFKSSLGVSHATGASSLQTWNLRQLPRNLDRSDIDESMSVNIGLGGINLLNPRCIKHVRRRLRDPNEHNSQRTDHPPGLQHHPSAKTFSIFTTPTLSPSPTSVSRFPPSTSVYPICS